MADTQITQQTRNYAVSEKPLATVEIPMELPSLANLREHWTKCQRRAKQQKSVTRFMINNLRKISLPIRVRLIRCSPRKLDSDNNVSAFKNVRDCVADWLRPGLAPGQADNTDEIVWQYDQESAKDKGFRIEFYPLIPTYTQNQV